MFRKIKYRGMKVQIRKLLRERLTIKSKIRYYESKIKSHKEKILFLEKETLVAVEKKLSFYLEENK